MFVFRKIILLLNGDCEVRMFTGIKRGHSYWWPRIFVLSLDVHEMKVATGASHGTRAQ